MNIRIVEKHFMYSNRITDLNFRSRFNDDNSGDMYHDDGDYNGGGRDWDARDDDSGGFEC